eukprot:8512893-Karenia_brevis.AAC.1
MEIQEQRNTDHGGALPLYLPLIGDNYDFKQHTHTWAHVAKTSIANERIAKYVFETKPSRTDYEDMDQP